MHNHQLLALRAIAARVPGGGDSDSPTAEKVRAILTHIEKEASAVLELMEHPDPMKSSVAIDLLINQEKARLRDLIARSRGELNGLVSGFRDSREAARRTKANLVPDSFAAESRSVFRQLDTESKHAFMATAIKAGDSATVAAIVTVPAILSGLSATQQADYREAFLDTVAPSSAGIADEMQAAVDTALRVAESFAQPAGIASGTQTIEAQKAVALAARAA